MIHCCLSCHCTGFVPEEVGTEGQGYIWRPEADSDDEREQMQDIWGEKGYRHLRSHKAVVTVLKKKTEKIVLPSRLALCARISRSVLDVSCLAKLTPVMQASLS